MASPVKLAPLAPEPPDHFELIWPSGDIDEQFGSESPEPYPHPDIDRAGVTARLVGPPSTGRTPQPDRSPSSSRVDGVRRRRRCRRVTRSRRGSATRTDGRRSPTTSCSPYDVRSPRSTPARSLPAVVSPRCRASACPPTDRSVPGRSRCPVGSRSGPIRRKSCRSHADMSAARRCSTICPRSSSRRPTDESADTVVADDAGDSHRTSRLATPDRQPAPPLSPAFSRRPRSTVRRAAKKSTSNRPHSSASTPTVRGTRWLSSGLSTRSNRLPAAPAFGSVAPYTSCPRRPLTIAPAHIAHGSSVTTSVQSSSRQCPITAAASRSASTSAWAVGSPVSSRSL